VRVGNGFDIHRLVVGLPLILGGVRIPSEFGLEGHSDGDALCHAVADSILGALAMGDIGMLFPSDDPFYRGANSLELLKQVVNSAKERGFIIINCDCVIICERPKLSPYYEQMRKTLSEALSIEESRVGMKARTMDGLGSIGRGEAIAVQSVVLLDNIVRRSAR
jgi:2-C-methyl-D-erythritol 2,4-cyclodiphosphate synthase